MKVKQCVLFSTDHVHSTVFTPDGSCCTESLHVQLFSTVLCHWKCPHVVTVSLRLLLKISMSHCMCECSIRPHLSLLIEIKSACCNWKLQMRPNNQQGFHSKAGAPWEPALFQPWHYYQAASMFATEILSFVGVWFCCCEFIVHLLMMQLLTAGSSSTALVSICWVYRTLFGLRFWGCGGICLNQACWLNRSSVLNLSVIKGNPSLSMCVFWCVRVYVWVFVFVCLISSFFYGELWEDVPLWLCALFSWLRLCK